MEIQSLIQISKNIEVSDTDDFGNEIIRQIGFLAASIDRQGQQCGINIQIFEKERFGEFSNEISQQIFDFFAHLNACARGSNLSVLNEVFPFDEEVYTKVAKMSL